MGDKQANPSEAGVEPQTGFTDRLAKAMRHPLRVRLLALMNERPWSPRELNLETGEGLSLVSYHVKVLKDLEMIEETSNRPVRGAVEHFYRATARAYVSPEMARHIPKSAQELAGIDIIREIDKDVGKALGGGAFYRREDWHLSWTPLLMDDEGCAEAERIAVQAVKDIIAVAAQAATRLAEGGPDLKPIPIGLGVLLYGRSEEKKPKAPSPKAKKRSTSPKAKKRGTSPKGKKSGVATKAKKRRSQVAPKTPVRTRAFTLYHHCVVKFGNSHESFLFDCSRQGRAAQLRSQTSDRRPPLANPREFKPYGASPVSVKSAGAALKAQQDHRALCRRFGANVRRARVSISLSQEELGSRCAAHRTEVSLIERGQREPRLEVIVKLSTALKTPIDDLIDGIEWVEPGRASSPYGSFRALPLTSSASERAAVR